MLLRSTLAATLLVAAATANSALVTLDSLTVDWTAVVPTSIGTSATDNGTQAASIRWGNPVSGSAGQSGYDFTTVGTSAGVNVPPSPSAQFDLGTFEHINIPIRGTTLTSASLDLGANIIVDGIDFGRRSFVVDIFHEETPNGSNPCANGGANNTGVNVNGCADIVTFGFNNASENFIVGNDFYTLEVLGFRVGNVLNQAFETLENQTNSAVLVAQVQVDTRVPPPTGVPEPTGMALLGLGLVGLFARRQRQRA